jgi:hypothetical protein
LLLLLFPFFMVFLISRSKNLKNLWEEKVRRVVADETENIISYRAPYQRHNPKFVCIPKQINRDRNGTDKSTVSTVVLIRRLWYIWPVSLSNHLENNIYYIIYIHILHIVDVPWHRHLLLLLLCRLVWLVSRLSQSLPLRNAQGQQHSKERLYRERVWLVICKRFDFVFAVFILAGLGQHLFLYIHHNSVI